MWGDEVSCQGAKMQHLCWRGQLTFFERDDSLPRDVCVVETFGHGLYVIFRVDLLGICMLQAESMWRAACGVRDE